MWPAVALAKPRRRRAPPVSAGTRPARLEFPRTEASLRRSCSRLTVPRSGLQELEMKAFGGDDLILRVSSQEASPIWRTSPRPSARGRVRVSLTGDRRNCCSAVSFRDQLLGPKLLRCHTKRFARTSLD